MATPHHRNAPVTLSELQMKLIAASDDMLKATAELRETLVMLRNREDARHERFNQLMEVLSGDSDELLVAAE